MTLVTVIGFALVPTLVWTGALPKPETEKTVAFIHLIGGRTVETGSANIPIYGNSP